MVAIEKDIQALEDSVINFRRQLHRIPEQGFKEYETTKYIYDILKKCGIDAEIGLSGTGVTGFVKGTSDDTIAFRADIDALSVEEQTNLEFCSTKSGFMHACGHDGHMAILLGFAKYISENRDILKDNVLFIFQPAEEGPGGAEPIVKSGLLERYNVKCIFGLHIYPDIDEGKIGCRPGAMMAQTGEFDIYVKGKGAHGAMPYKGIDALLAAATLVNTLNTIIGRNIDPIEPAVLTVGRLEAGERRNIIAENAVLEGTMRAFNEETYQRIRTMLLKQMKAVTEAYECTVEYEIRDMYPPVVNDEKLFEVLHTITGKEDFELLRPLTISEDFSYYQKKVPGLFFMLGSRNDRLGKVHALHSNKFDFNEEIMLIGIQTMYNLYKALS